MNDLILSLSQVSKSFGERRAVDAVSFQIERGQTLGLIGPNGAGKSTIMKILTGVLKKDEGKIFYKGNEVDIHNTKHAKSLGISIIHQELNLMPDLTVAENIFIGKEPMRFGGLFTDDKKIITKAKELLLNMNVTIDPTVKVESLTVAQQQMVEIAKALSFDSEVPTRIGLFFVLLTLYNNLDVCH